eukprot:8903194-Karenia_brevis.AAC.1
MRGEGPWQVQKGMDLEMGTACAQLQNQMFRAPSNELLQYFDVIDVPADGACFLYTQLAQENPTEWALVERHINGVPRDKSIYKQEQEALKK